MELNVSKNILNLYRIGPHEGRLDFCRLDMNENPSGLPKDFFDKVIEKITPEVVASYPEPARLVREIGKYLFVSPEHIVLTNGSDDGIRMIFQVFGGMGKSIVSVNPTFEMYNVYAKMYGMNQKIVQYAKDFSVSVEEILENITSDVSLVALLNPNNPIGTAYTIDEAISVIEKARTVNALVILDEAYYYFYDKTFLSLVEKYDNVIITRTFSKLCSIAGLRIGYCVGSAEIIRCMSNAMPSYNVNAVAIEFAYCILKDEKIIPALIANELEGRGYLIQKLQEANYKFLAQHGNFLFIRPKTSVAIVEKNLYEHKILVKTYSNDLLKEYVRISTGNISVMEMFWRAFISCDKY